MTKTKDYSYIILVYLLSLLKRIVEVVFSVIWVTV